MLSRFYASSSPPLLIALLSLICILPQLATCRDITFPPQSPFVAGGSKLTVHSQHRDDVRQLSEGKFKDGDGDFMSEDYKFRGLITFANLPYVWCSALAPAATTEKKEQEPVEGYDIAFLGAPFDTV